MSGNDKIKVTRKTVSEGRMFYDSLIDKALSACLEGGMTPLFMPDLVSNRIEAGKDSPYWQKWFTVPSVRVTGKSKGGKGVVVYAHQENHFSDPENIRNARADGKTVNGAGVMPKDAFYALLDQEGNGKVFVVDYDTLRKAPSDVVAVKKALDHPQTVPFLGIGKEGAEAYLARHKQVFGRSIGIWHTDDLGDEPLGRLLYLGDIYGYGGLYGYCLDIIGRFVGVAPEAQVTVKKSEPGRTLDSDVERLQDGRIVRVDGELYVKAPKGLELRE